MCHRRFLTHASSWHRQQILKTIAVEVGCVDSVAKGWVGTNKGDVRIRQELARTCP